MSSSARSGIPSADPTNQRRRQNLETGSVGMNVYSPPDMTISSNAPQDMSSNGSFHPHAHVVMMVANDVGADTRVRKMAESLASTGVTVTVIGVDLRGDGFESKLGRADLIVRKAGRRFRDARSRLGRRAKVGWVKSELDFRRESFQLEQRETGSQIEWIREDGRAQRRSIRDRAVGRKEKALDRYSAARLSLKQKARGGNRVARLGGRAGVRLVDLRYRTIRSVHRARTILDFKMAQLGPQARERSVRRRLSLEKTKLDSRVRRLKRKLIRAQRSTGRRRLISLRRGNWRRDLPDLDDYEAAIGPLLDGLDADVFHAHDVHLLGVATRAAARARYRGVDTRVIYDAHEYIAGLARYSKQIVEAYTSVEREYIHRANRVITVSEPLADLLEHDFSLEHRPQVVLNIPMTGVPGGHVPSLYGAAGIPLDAEVMVYSGGMDEARNVHTIVAALPLLADDVHLVLVARRESDYVLSLFELAEKLGVGDRVHMAPFVRPNEVVGYLSEASVGIHPMISSKMNHQIALPNKLFEYLHAGLPMCVSDNRAMMDFVTENGLGEWFIAENPESLAKAVARVLADRDRYVQARYEDPDLLRRFSWDRQAERLIDVYRDLLRRPDLEIGRFSAAEDHVPDERVTDEPVVPKARLAIGPINQAGHASLWAYGLSQNLPNVSTSTFTVVGPETSWFTASHPITIADWWDPEWQDEHQRWIAHEFTHVMIESGSSVLGGGRGAYFDRDIDVLRTASVMPALLFHGSEIRSPEIHRGLVEASPFHVRDDLTMRLEASTAEMLDLVSDFDGPVFVSTKDLLDYIPHAEWLPHVVGATTWAQQPLHLGERRLVVVSTATNRRLEGTDQVDAVCRRLAEEGRIEYRRYANVAPEKMPGIIAAADVLIDGISLGRYGITSVEGMAAGRLVLGNIDRVVDKSREIPPIVNVNPSTLGDVLADITDRPEHYREVAGQGPGYVRRYHDGRYSAEQLAGFLGVEIPADLWSGDRAGAGARS